MKVLSKANEMVVEVIPGCYIEEEAQRKRILRRLETLEIADKISPEEGFNISLPHPRSPKPYNTLEDGRLTGDDQFRGVIEELLVGHPDWNKSFITVSEDELAAQAAEAKRVANLTTVDKDELAELRKLKVQKELKKGSAKDK